MSDEELNQSQNREEQLYRYLLLVSYSGMGVDRSLDEYLNQLRKALKRQAPLPEIKGCVDNITDCLRHIEESVETSKLSRDPNQIILNIIDSLITESIDRPFRKSLNALKKQFHKNNSFDLTNQFKYTVSNELERLKGKSKGWSLFGGKSDKVEDENNVEANDIVESAINKEPVSYESQTIDEDIKDSLRHFVEQLGTIDIYKKATSEIHEHLGHLNYQNELSPLIENITSSLLEAANIEHVQFESFLKSLNKRLLHVASFLNQASAGNKDLLDDSQLLEKELKETIQTLQTDVQASEALGPLKSRLLSSFEHIIQSVNLFNDAQKTKLTASNAELRIVQEQLKATEDETERLKQNLIEQRSLAYTDPLSKLPNRFAYNERLNQEYSRWRRYRSPLAIAIGDLDFFKQVNDNFGHSTGDTVLTHISKILRDGVRESDFIARYGGEEFIIIMPETSIVDATKAINKLRQTVYKEHILISEQKSIQVTMSFGVAEFEGSDTAMDVFNRSDKALYRAKAKGRNQVCCEKG